MAVRRCSECPKPLVSEDGTPALALKKTCSKSCRAKRARRLKRARMTTLGTSPYGTDLDQVAAAVRGQTADVAHEVLAEELRPIVREAMTADVLRSIDDLIKLNPAAIAALQTQLDSDDETISQRAATLILKFTMGNPSVAPPPTQAAPAPMSVTFNIPRPGDTSSEPPISAEMRQCTDCSEHKMPDDFVGASPRCQECFDNLQATLTERFAVVDETKP